jgi:hypothetical protein
MVPDANPVPAWSRNQRVVMLLLVVIGVAVGWTTRTRIIGNGGDEATYLLLAESLTQGGYHDVALLDRPLHTKYPPGNAAWIAGLRFVFGADPDIVRLANLLLLALTGLLAADGIRRALLAPWVGVVALAAIVFNATLMELAPTALSEMPFTAAIMLSSWAMLVARERPSGTWTWLGVFAAMGSLLVRGNGVAQIAAVVAGLPRTHRRRALVILGIGGGVAVALATWWLAVGAPESSYLEDLTRGYARQQRAPTPVTAKAIQYGDHVLHDYLQIPNGENDRAGQMAIVAIVIPTLFAGAWMLARRWPVLLMAAGTHGVILLAWPWAIERLGAPLVPTLIIVLLTGATSVGDALWRRTRRAGVTVAVGAGLTIVALNLRDIARWPPDGPCEEGRPANCRDRFIYPMRAGIQAAARVLPVGAPLAAGDRDKASVLYYFGRLPIVPITTVLPAMDVEGVSALRRAKVHAILVVDEGLLRKFTVARRLLPHCRDLVVVWASLPDAALLVSGRPTAERPSSCPSLRAIARTGRPQRRPAAATAPPP